MTLDQLQRIVPPPKGRHIEVDWPSVEQRLGSPLPVDYRALVETYGPGAFDDFLHILQPSSVHEPIDLERQKDRMMWALNYLAEGGEPMPYPLPELLPIGKTDNGDGLYWLRRPASEPDAWAIVVNEARGPEWVEYPGGIVAFLADVLSATYRVAVFPDDFPGAVPAFTPYD